MAPIEEAILIEAVLDTRAQVDFLWQFFVTVHIAIFAMLFIYGEAVERLSLVARAFAVIGIGLFDFINGQALINVYQLLDAIIDQYRVNYGHVDRFQALFYERFVLMDHSSRPDMVRMTHSLAFVVVLIALVARHWIQSGSGSTNGEHSRPQH